MLLRIDLLGLEQQDLEWYQMMVRAVIVFIVTLIFIRIAGMRSFGFRSLFDVALSIRTQQSQKAGRGRAEIAVYKSFIQNKFCKNRRMY